MNNTIPSQIANDFYKTLLDNIFDAVYMVNNQGIIVYWNDSCARLTGFGSEEMVGQFYQDTLFGSTTDGHPDNYNGIDIALTTGMPGTWKGQICRRNGQRLPVESHVSPVRDHNADTIGVVAVFRDISAHVALEDAHRKMLATARLDPLTGLHNRLSINEILGVELDRASRYNQPLSVVIVDIDHFKRFNDNYGHETGDIILKNVADVFFNNLRKPDIAGRWGGEEFIIIAPGSDAIDAARMAERLRKFIHDVHTQHCADQVTASFGIAQYSHGLMRDQLICLADRAMYQAKNGGRNRVVVSREDDDLHILPDYEHKPKL